MNSVNTLTEVRPTRFGPQRLADLGTKLRASLALLPLLVGAFLLFGTADATATVNLTIHNTGCEDMKVYKKDWVWENYQTTISAGSSWSCWTWDNQEFVFRKTNSSYISNYFCTFSSNQSHLYNGLGVRVKAFQVDEIYSRFYEMDIRDLKEGHYVVWINVDGFRPVAKTLVVGRM